MVIAVAFKARGSQLEAQQWQTADPSSIPSTPKNFSEENIVDISEVNQWRCLEDSGQWLDLKMLIELI